MENKDNQNSEIYNGIEHLSNARLMPLTGPYGRLDILDIYEYATVPEKPDTPLEPYEIIYEKNIMK